MKPLTAPVLATAGAVALAASLGGGVSAQDPSSRTLVVTELEQGATFTHVRNTKVKSSRANPQGDLLASRNPVADESGRRVGAVHTTCVTTEGSRNFERSRLTCTGILVLRDGTLTAQFLAGPTLRRVTGAVTGGTGAYAHARGTFITTVARDGTRRDTITLVD
jgi:hypothetical protein